MIAEYFLKYKMFDNNSNKNFIVKNYYAVTN